MAETRWIGGSAIRSRREAERALYEAEIDHLRARVDKLEDEVERLRSIAENLAYVEVELERDQIEAEEAVRRLNDPGEQTISIEDVERELGLAEPNEPGAGQVHCSECDWIGKVSDLRRIIWSAHDGACPNCRRITSLIFETEE